MRTDGLALVHASEDLRDDEDFCGSLVRLESPVLTMSETPFHKLNTRFLCLPVLDFSIAKK